MTDLEIAQFSGEDETKPIYLAINGTIYDVSVGARHYGPKGSYHIFAGREASRAFISSCFETDSIPDMRGVEQQFLPLDDPQIDAEIESNIGADGMRMLRAEELRRAKQVRTILLLMEAWQCTKILVGGIRQARSLGEVLCEQWKVPRDRQNEERQSMGGQLRTCAEAV